MSAAHLAVRLDRNNIYSMTSEMYDKLSRLERRIMDVVYRLGEAPVADVVAALGEHDAHNSIRVTMANLEKKGFLRHGREGTRNVYSPTVSESTARESAMQSLLRTFFEGSPGQAILGLLDESAGSLTEEQILEIRARIAEAEAEGS